MYFGRCLEHEHNAEGAEESAGGVGLSRSASSAPEDLEAATSRLMGEMELEQCKTTTCAPEDEGGDNTYESEWVELTSKTFEIGDELLQDAGASLPDAEVSASEASVHRLYDAWESFRERLREGSDSQTDAAGSARPTFASPSEAYHACCRIRDEAIDVMNAGTGLIPRPPSPSGEVSETTKANRALRLARLEFAYARGIRDGAAELLRRLSMLLVRSLVDSFLRRKTDGNVDMEERLEGAMREMDDLNRELRSLKRQPGELLELRRALSVSNVQLQQLQDDLIESKKEQLELMIDYQRVYAAMSEDEGALSKLSADDLEGLEDDLTSAARRVARERGRREAVAQACDSVGKLPTTQQCGICLDRSKELVFNCGHSVCRQCANDLVLCPFCRTEIENRI